MSTIERVLTWLIGIAILGLVLWSSFIKPTDKIAYAPDSKPVQNTITRWPFTIDLNFSCQRTNMDMMKKEGLKN